MYLYETLDEGRICRCPFLISETVDTVDSSLCSGSNYFDSDSGLWKHILRKSYNHDSDRHYLEIIYTDLLGVVYAETLIFDTDGYTDFYIKYLNPTMCVTRPTQYGNSEQRTQIFNFIDVMMKFLNVPHESMLIESIYITFFKPFIMKPHEGIIKSVRGMNLQITNNHDVYIRFTEITHKKNSNGRIVADISFPIEDFLRTYPLNLRVYDYLFTIRNVGENNLSFIVYDEDSLNHLIRFHGEFSFYDDDGVLNRIIICKNAMSFDEPFYFLDNNHCKQNIEKIYGKALTPYVRP